MKDLLLFAVRGFIEHLGLLVQIGHPLLGKRSPDDVTRQVFRLLDLPPDIVPVPQALFLNSSKMKIPTMKIKRSSQSFHPIGIVLKMF
jgi:hypothetical protein